MNTTDQTTKSATCYCGCGETVKNTYRPGHDARHVSNLIRAWAESSDPTEAEAAAMRLLPTLALQAKFQNAVANTKRKAEAKAEREANRAQRRADAKQAKAEAKLAEVVAQEEADYQAQVAPKIEADGGEIRIGRWTYPTGSKRGDDTIYRWTKTNLANAEGEWTEVK